MADPADPGVLDATSDTMVLALDLVDAEIRNSPERLIKALESPEVQKAIQKTMDDFAKDLIRKTPSTVSQADAEALAKKLLEAGGGKVVDNMTHGIKNSSKYVALDKSLKALSDKISKTPMGIWLDDNSTLVYIVGAGAVLGGVAAMYVARSGDAVTKSVFPLLGGQSVKFKLLGKLNMQVGLDNLAFTPSERLIEAKTFVTGSWKQITVKVNLAVTAADGKFTGAVDGKIVVPVTKGVTLQGAGGYNTGNQSYNLNITLGVDLNKNVNIGVMAGVGRGGFGKMPDGDAWKAMPEPPKDSGRTSEFVGLGISVSL